MPPELDEAKIGTPIGSVEVSDYARLKDTIRDKDIVVGVLAVPAPAAQKAADDLIAAFYTLLVAAVAIRVFG